MTCIVFLRRSVISLVVGVLSLMLGERASLSWAQSSPNDVLTKGATEVAWVSQNKTADQLGEQISDLYLSLYNTSPSRITTQLYSVEGTMTVEDIMRRTSLFMGVTFPQLLDNLICDLNEHVCSRPKLPISDRDRTILTRHASGFVPSKSSWHIENGTSLLLPALALNKLVRWVPYVKLRGHSLEDIVLKELQGCDVFDELCRNSIKNFNRKDDEIFNNDFGGDNGQQLILPVIAARSSVDITAATESPRGEQIILPRPAGRNLVISRVIDASLQSRPLYKLANTPYDDVFSTSKPHADLNTLFNQLISNLLSQSILRLQATASNATELRLPEDFRQRQTKMLKAMSFPYDSLSAFPMSLRWPVGILVFDKWVDASHCAFTSDPSMQPPRRALDIQNIEPHTMSNRANCNEEVAASPVGDHGTHVTGLIAARNSDGTMWGINPYADVHTREINIEDSPTQGDKISMSLQNTLAANRIEVVNLSWGWIRTALRSPDPVEQAIAVSGTNQLFVVAAGNDLQNEEHICDYRPSCYDLPNVLSVAGLTESETDPRLWVDPAGGQGTNFGKHVHVAAWGENVFSTIAGGRFGVLSGTSQAAPQVAALASLVFAKHMGRLSPKQVKDRIIICSDILDSLRGQLFGGRVNARCTLDDEFDRFVTTTGEVHGRVQIGILKFTKDNEEYEFSTRQIRGIQSRDGGRFTIFYQPGSGVSAPLLKESDLRPSTVGQKIKVAPVVSNTSDIDVLLSDILRYAVAIQ